MIHARKHLAAATALALLPALLASPAMASQPVTDSAHGTGISCTAEDGDGFLAVDAFFSTTGELIGPGGVVEGPELVAWVYGGEGSLAEDGEFTVTVDFATDSGAGVGSLTISGSTEPVGELQTIDERYRDGNAWSTVAGTTRELLVSASVTEATDQLAGLVGAELSCEGAQVDLEFWGTNPATRIYRSAGASAFCPLGESGLLSVDVWGEGAVGFVALGIDWEAETADLVAEGELVVDGASITGDLPVVEPAPSSEPESVAVNLTIGAEMDRGAFRAKDRQGAFHERYTTYALTGTVTAPGYESITIEDCEYRVSDSWERYSSQAGQKPGGRAPANELPGNALALADGSTARLSTRGAAEAPEAQCVVDSGTGPYEVPLGRTVWYRFTGTGDDVTLSTAGSDFDTVIGLYDAATHELLACVDDTPEGLQALLTVEATADSEYLVQVGGFAADFGRLVVSRS